MRPPLLAIAILLALAGESRAQVTIDVAKITCEQFILFKVSDPNNIALWLSGYYNAKHNNTLIDPQALEHNIDRLRQFCRTNLGTPLMQAADATLGQNN